MIQSIDLSNTDLTILMFSKRETCYWPLAAIIFVGNVPDSVRTKTTIHIHGHCVVRAIGSVSDQRSFVEMLSGDDFLSSKNQA